MSPDSDGRRRLIRPAIFLVVLAIAVWWVATSGDDQDALVRSFLRSLARHLF